MKIMRNILLLLLSSTLFTGRLAAQCNVVITNPAAVCFPATVDLSAAAVTAGSDAGLTFTYWTDAGATIPYASYKTATAGTYYIKGDNGGGCTQVQPVTVTVTIPPTAVISYAGTPFCKALSTPQAVTLTGTGAYTGGTYSSTAGLTINSGTGAITPGTSNAGIYTVTYTVPASGGCPAVPVITTVAVVDIPSAPVVGTVTQPTCNISTGSVPLSGLPATGDWIVTASPGGATSSGNGTTTVINGLMQATTFTFKVTNYAGCISASSGSAVVQSQPLTPSPPVIGTITAPTCTVTTGSVILNGLPASGTWTLSRYPGGVTSSGSGTSTTISGLPQGTYNFTVTNSSSCVSGLSDAVVIPIPPSSPLAPIVGAITQPTCAVATGSVALSGLPASGTWKVTISPGGSAITGSGTTASFPGIFQGTYTFSVAGANGCSSPPSGNAVINAQPVTPTAPVIGDITQPTCVLATGSVVLNSLPSGNWVLTRIPGNVTTSGSGTSWTITGLAPGDYQYTVTSSSGCVSPLSNKFTINPSPTFPGTPNYTTNCDLGFGHAVLTVTLPIGTDLQYSLDAGAYQSSNVFSEVSNGNHYLSVRNIEGCTTSTGIFAVSCGCVNPPLVNLSLTSDSTCGTSPLTVSGNTFSGSATSVTITEDGTGTVFPTSATASPFSFTYTPGNGDKNKVVTITVTSNNPLGSPCMAAVVKFALTVNSPPSAPSVGTVTGLTCTTSTGSVVLNGLPSGTWTLLRSPDNVTETGTGSSTTVTGLTPGTYTFTVTSEAGCVSPASAEVTINPQPLAPTAPVIDSIADPTCAVSTGTVYVSGLPATGSWILTRLPGGSTSTGSGTTYAATTIAPGSYTFTVTNSAGCVSPPSLPFTVKDKPLIPTAPSVGTIKAPTCAIATGSVFLFGLPSTGTWTLTRLPGTITTTGTGTSDTIKGLPPGTYNFTVRNQAGCLSGPSDNVVIPNQPVSPTAPVIGTITQPTYSVPTGSVALSGLPSSGAWVLTRLPDNVTTAGTGATFTVAGLAGGAYTFTVSNTVGCTSPASKPVTISTLGPPKLIITDPPPACFPGTVDLTAPEVTAGSTGGLIYTYWIDSLAQVAYPTPEAATAGTYYIKGTTVSNYYNIQPVIATVLNKPVANGGADQVLPIENSTFLNATLGVNETGYWKVISGTGVVADTTDPSSSVSNLSPGKNFLSWNVSNGACPVASDTIKIIVGEIVVPTLITPNGDNKNEYFVIQGLESLGKTELVIFDRRGYQLFRNLDYDNKWNGVDYNEKPLPDDTYFYLLKPANHTPVTGFIVIRR